MWRRNRQLIPTPELFFRRVQQDPNPRESSTHAASLVAGALEIVTVGADTQTEPHQTVSTSFLSGLLQSVPVDQAFADASQSVAASLVSGLLQAVAVDAPGSAEAATVTVSLASGALTDVIQDLATQQEAFQTVSASLVSGALA